MVLSFVKKNHPLILFLAPLMAAVPYILMFNKDPQPVTQNITPVFLWFQNIVSDIDYAWLIVPYALIIAQFFLLVKMNSRFIFIEGRTFLDGIVFLFLVLSLFYFRLFSPAIVSGIFLMFTFFSLFRLEKETNLQVVFDTSIILSIGSLFNWGLIYYLIPVWLAFLIIKTMSMREFLVSLAGIITPYIFYLFWFFWNDDIQGFQMIMHKQFQFNATFPDLNYREMAYFSSLILFFLICLFASMSSMKAKKIIRRKYFTIFFILTFYSFVLCVINRFDTGHLIISFPFFSVLIANYFISSKSKFLTELVFTILVGIAAFNIFA